MTFAQYFPVLYLSQHTRFRYVLYKRKRLPSTHILASHEILVLNASTSSDGSDELARMRSILRAFDSHKHIIWKKRQNIRPTAPLDGDKSKSLANRLRSHLIYIYDSCAAIIMVCLSTKHFSLYEFSFTIGIDICRTNKVDVVLNKHIAYYKGNCVRKKHT